MRRELEPKAQKDDLVKKIQQIIYSAKIQSNLKEIYLLACLCYYWWRLAKLLRISLSPNLWQVIAFVFFSVPQPRPKRHIHSKLPKSEGKAWSECAFLNVSLLKYCTKLLVSSSKAWTCWRAKRWLKSYTSEAYLIHKSCRIYVEKNCMEIYFHTIYISIKSFICATPAISLYCTNQHKLSIYSLPKKWSFPLRVSSFFMQWLM